MPADGRSPQSWACFLVFEETLLNRGTSTYFPIAVPENPEDGVGRWERENWGNGLSLRTPQAFSTPRTGLSLETH